MQKIEMKMQFFEPILIKKQTIEKLYQNLSLHDMKEVQAISNIFVNITW